MYEFDSLCIYVFIHVKFIYDCNIWLYYQLTTVTDTYFRFLDENIDYMVNMWSPQSKILDLPMCGGSGLADFPLRKT